MTVFNVTELKNYFGANVDGIALANRYLISLPTIAAVNTVAGPGAVAGPTPPPLEFMAFNSYCRSVNMPGKQLLSVDRPVMGTFQKVAYGFAATDVDMVFMSGSDMYVKEYFDHWQNLAFNMRDETERFPKPAYKNTYVHDVEVWQLNKNGDRKFGIKMIDAFPQSVNPIELSDASTDQPTQIGVQMTYKSWHRITGE